MKKILIYNLFYFIIFYSFVEIFTGTFFFKNKLDCSYLMCNKVYNFLTPFDFYKNDNNTLYSRDKYGFRGRYKELSKIDILTVGGSTTDERFLKLQDTWSEKLEQKFLKNNQKIDVVNSGIDGQSTYGHIWNFEEWFNKLENFKPKYILFYIGINERLDLMHYDNHIGGPKNFNLYSKIKYYIKKNNGITYKLIHLMYKKFFLKNVYVVNKGVSHIERIANYKFVDNNYELSNDYSEYLNENLKKILNYSKQLGSEPIFITQKTLLGKVDSGKYLSVNNINNFIHEQSLANIIIQFCIKNDIKCLDLNNDIQFLKADTYDLIHTTPSGSSKIADYIYSKLSSYIKFN